MGGDRRSWRSEGDPPGEQTSESATHLVSKPRGLYYGMQQSLLQNIYCLDCALQKRQELLQIVQMGQITTIFLQVGGSDALR